MNTNRASSRHRQSHQKRNSNQAKTLDMDVGAEHSKRPKQNQNTTLIGHPDLNTKQGGKKREEEEQQNSGLDRNTHKVWRIDRAAQTCRQRFPIHDESEIQHKTTNIMRGAKQPLPKTCIPKKTVTKP